MSPSDPVLQATRALVERVAGPGRTPPDAGLDTRLGDGYWLDSIDLLEVVVACEREFGIVFDAAVDFDAGAFETLGTLTRLIRAKQAAAREGR